MFKSDFLGFAVGQTRLYKRAQKVNPGSYKRETCSKRQLIPDSFRAYQYLKIEVWALNRDAERTKAWAPQTPASNYLIVHILYCACTDIHRLI